MIEITNINIPIYLVDDDKSVRDSLQFMLESYQLKVTAFENGDQFLKNAVLDKPGCAILDSRMPVLTGQMVHQQLKEKNSFLSVIFLTGHGDVPMAVDAMNEGAFDFLQKTVDSEKLIAAITNACQFSMDNRIKHEAVNAYRALTHREKDLLILIVKGYKNKEIAERLIVSMRTVEVHRSNLMKKFNSKTIAELIIQYGYVVDLEGLSNNI